MHTARKNADRARSRGNPIYVGFSELPNITKFRIALLQNNRITGLLDYRILSDYRIAESPNYWITESPDYQITKLPNCWITEYYRIAKLPYSQITDFPDYQFTEY